MVDVNEEAADSNEIMTVKWDALNEKLNEIVTWFQGYTDSVISEVIAALVIAALLAIYGYRKKVVALTVGFVKLGNNFLQREECFTYRQNEDDLPVCIKVSTHLENKSLLGLIEPPEIYGIYRKNSSGRYAVEASKRLLGVKRVKVDKYLRKCIVPYRLLVGDDKDGEWVDAANAVYLIDKLMVPAASRNDVKAIMIRGKVGCGKSTLVMSIASGLMERNKHHNAPGNYAVVVIDVRKLLFNSFRFDDEFHKEVFHPDFTHKVIGRLKSEVVRLLKDTRIPSVADVTGYEDALEFCYNAGVSPVIVFDELDYLYSDFAKRFVADVNGPNSKCLNMYKELFSRICEIHLESPFPSPLQSVTVTPVFIIVARSSTKKLMEGVLGQKGMGGLIHVKLDEASRERVNEIIRRQIESLYQHAEGEQARNLRSIVEQLKSGNIDFSKNIAVSVHGVRHLINAIAKLAEHSDSNFELLRLVVTNPGMLRLFQYVDGNPDYSQAEEGISNIYLVNRDSPKKCKDRNNSVESFDDCLLGNHLQSYWLKYFLCKYIIYKSRNLDSEVGCAPIHFNAIVDVFSIISEYAHTKYEKSIVKLALLHASKVDHGRLIKFEYKEGVGKVVLPSSRLLRMSDDDVFWDFGYLMVVIEDKWLEFPKSIYEKFFSSSERTTVHGFVTNYHLLSDEQRLDFVKDKALQVMVFYEVLMVSLKYEKDRYKSVFSRISEDGICVDIEGDFGTHLSRSIIEFAKTYITPGAENDIGSYIHEFNSKQREKVRRLAVKSYKKYHKEPTIRSMESRMKQYYLERT